MDGSRGQWDRSRWPRLGFGLVLLRRQAIERGVEALAVVDLLRERSNLVSGVMDVAIGPAITSSFKVRMNRSALALS
jgi:hypothetical protein